MRRPATTAALSLMGFTAATAVGAWKSAATPPPPGIVVATVGAPITLKVEKGATIGPVANGLVEDNGKLTGTPLRPLVMYAAKGTDTTWIVVFARDLPVPELPPTPLGYIGGSRPVPSHINAGVRIVGVSLVDRDSMEANPITDAGATLGRVLFYDRRLSANDGVACASCHHQSMGFGDSARFSRGVGGVTKRHSMALANVRFSATTGLFWDQRAKSLEQQVLMPIQDSIEMGLSLADLSKKLQATDYYPPLYEAAFGSPDITMGRTARALAQFLRSMVSAEAPFDVAKTVAQAGGAQVFSRSGCGICHIAGAQTMVSALNSGLDSVPSDAGAGRGRFRPPSLRNIAVRPPYMHDGRFRTLDEVIDFYASQVAFTPNLDVRLRAGPNGARRLQLSETDRQELHAFLNGLTDSTFLNAKEFSDPFRPRK